MELNYLNLFTTDAAWNLAAEQYVFDTLPRDRAYLMLWQNKSAVVIGKYQNVRTEVNVEYLHEHQIQLVRRLSGGGAVYHDLGNLNFSFIAEAGSFGKLDFARFGTPILHMLQAYGIPAELNGRNDMVVDGMKFSGNAQYIRHGRILHHGTLLFDSDLNVVSQALNPDAEKLKSNGVSSVRSRVTNLKPFFHLNLTLDEFRKSLLNHILTEIPGKPYMFSESDRCEIERIKRERYDSWDWTYGRSPAGTIEKKRRIDGCGTIGVILNLKNDLIEDISFHGDFFSAEDPERLAKRLAGSCLNENELRTILAEVDVSSFIQGLDADTLIHLLLY